MTELETKLLGALKKAGAALENCNRFLNWNDRQAILPMIDAAIAAAEAAQQVGDIDVVELTNKSYMDGVNDGIEAEREACEVECEKVVSGARSSAPEHHVTGVRMGAAACAASIRARGNKH